MRWIPGSGGGTVAEGPLIRERIALGIGDVRYELHLMRNRRSGQVRVIDENSAPKRGAIAGVEADAIDLSCKGEDVFGLRRGQVVQRAIRSLFERENSSS